MAQHIPHVHNPFLQVASRESSPVKMRNLGTLLNFGWSTDAWPAPTYTTLQKFLSIIGRTPARGDSFYAKLQNLNLQRELQSAERCQLNLRPFETRKDRGTAVLKAYRGLKAELRFLASNSPISDAAVQMCADFDKQLHLLSEVLQSPLWEYPLVRLIGMTAKTASAS